MEYELVREIQNLCPNNQMRDIFFDEVETDDPVAYVRSFLKGKAVSLTADSRADGTVTVYHAFPKSDIADNVTITATAVPSRSITRDFSPVTREYITTTDTFTQSTLIRVR